MLHPLLRWPLDIQETTRDGESVYIIRDPLGVAEEPIVANATVMFVLSLLDGSHNCEELHSRIAPFGLTREDLDDFLSELDAMYFIESPRSADRWSALRRDFSSSTLRPAALAGKAYPAEPTELARVMSTFAELGVRYSLHLTHPVPAVIVPHIDYRRGQPGYAAAAQLLKQIPRPDTIILIGTSHQPGNSPFILSRKHFETPLGTFPPATETIDRIAAAYGTDRAFGEEILHRSEHSLELQLPLLAHRYAGALPEIVPILVGSFHHHLETRTSPRAGGEIDDFIGILASTLRELRDAGQQVLLYGGVDLAHVGKFFGDTERMSDTQLPSIEHRDRQLLEAIFSGDGEALFEHMAEDTDRRRICGFPSIYTMLHALADSGQPVRGELLEYHQAVDPTSDCTVTFATAYWSPSGMR